MLKIIGAPGRYVQAENLLLDAGEYIKKIHSKIFILTDEFSYQHFQQPLQHSLKKANCDSYFDLFQSPNTTRTFHLLSQKVQSIHAGVILGIGGGKIMDAAKALGYYAELPVAVMPTIASTDAPCSAISVLYTEENLFDRYLYLPESPRLVLVDTKIIAEAPGFLLTAGMGDALSTYFEARAASKHYGTNSFNGHSTLAALSLAKQCYETLLADGLSALKAVNNQTVTPALERVIEANIYLSGIGFESGGLAGAHAFNNALSSIPECKNIPHGMKVAFGTLIQLLLENDMTSFYQVQDFCRQVCLPITLKELGLNASETSLIDIATKACNPQDSMHIVSDSITPAKVLLAMKKTDDLGKEK